MHVKQNQIWQMNWRLNLRIEWNMKKTWKWVIWIIHPNTNGKTCCYVFIRDLLSCFKFVIDIMVVETWWWSKTIHKYVFWGINYYILIWVFIDLWKFDIGMWKFNNDMVGFLQTCDFSIFVSCYWMTPPMKL